MTNIDTSTGGCSQHGPFAVCGHTDATCPEKRDKLEEASAKPELSSEKKADKIAKKHTAEIPEADREISDQSQVVILMYTFRSTMQRGGLFSAKDKFGNYPDAVSQKIAEITSGEAQPQDILAPLQEFVDDPIKGAEHMDKVMNIANSKLPDTIKKALLGIILVDGEKSPVDAYKRAVELVEEAVGSGRADESFKLVGSVRKDNNYVSDEADNIRRIAATQFLETIYPTIMQSDEVAFVRELTTMPYNDTQDPEKLKEKLTKLERIVGEDYTFANVDRFKSAKTIKELMQKFSAGEIEIDDVFGGLEEELPDIVANKFVQ